MSLLTQGKFRTDGDTLIRCHVAVTQLAGERLKDAATMKKATEDGRRLLALMARNDSVVVDSFVESLFARKDFTTRVVGDTPEADEGLLELVGLAIDDALAATEKAEEAGTIDTGELKDRT